MSDAVNQVVASRGRDYYQSDERFRSVEKGLASARALIREALVVQNDAVSSPSNSSQLLQASGFVPAGAIYKNALAFHR